ncbi:Uncharacterised protein [Mycobacteroides abscessus subsp. abscessus]|nr:Uncharacterised protein [Mycobacteroides abscessus subsp. abscessus]
MLCRVNGVIVVPCACRPPVPAVIQRSRSSICSSRCAAAGSRSLPASSAAIQCAPTSALNGASTEEL